MRDGNPFNPPRIPAWILRRSARYEDCFSLFGDFDEEFYELAAKQGKGLARRWYWKHALKSLPVFLKDSFYWRFMMLTNYLKIAFRNMTRSKGYSIINISGLAIGMACCILILLWVRYEMSYDRYHDNADRIYRLCLDANLGTPIRVPVSNTGAAPSMVNEYPEVNTAARLNLSARVAVEYNQKQFYQKKAGFADQAIFDVFSFDFISGDRDTALTAPYSVVITEGTAKNIFGDEDPLGKTILFDDGKDYTVTAVLKDIRSNSHFTFTMLRSFVTLAENTPNIDESWESFSCFTYLLLAENVNSVDLEKKFAELVDKNMGPILKAMKGKMEFFLQPVTSIHLRSEFARDLEPQGDIAYVILFSGIAVFILLIACFNFINLATARSASRAKEVGVRKTMGAVKDGLIKQFLGESLIFSFISVLLAVILALLVLPAFRSLSGKELSLNPSEMPWLIFGVLGLAGLVGVMSGLYPAVYLSSFQPVRVLKGNLRTGKQGSSFRRFLVVIQFVISVGLIIGSMTIYHQIRFMKNTRLGFEKEHVLVFDAADSIIQKLDSFRAAMEDAPGVLEIAAASRLPGRGLTKSVFFPEGFTEEQPQTMDWMSVDHRFLPTLGIELELGRNFSKEFATDPEGAVLINQTAARTYGWDQPLGKSFSIPALGGEGVEIRRVVGVVRDFHSMSLHEKIEPLVITNDPGQFGQVAVRIDGHDLRKTLDIVERKWKEFNPGHPFEVFFLDESFEELYRAEEKLGKITFDFAALAVFIGCLGLFGMASFSAERRIKEIGIRKILGATSVRIVGLLSKETLILIGVSNLIAWPLAYYGLSRWLQNFAYRIDLGIGVFLITALLSLVVAVLTVGYQALRAASGNPVDALRYE